MYVPLTPVLTLGLTFYCLVIGLLCPHYLHLVQSRVLSPCKVISRCWLSLQAVVENRVYFRLTQLVVVVCGAGLRLRSSRGCKAGASSKRSQHRTRKRVQPKDTGCPGGLTLSCLGSREWNCRYAAWPLLTLGQQRRSNPNPSNAGLPQVCLSSPNPLIFKAISILFEETSQQFESGASGGREVGKKATEGEGRRSRSESEPQRHGSVGQERSGKITACQHCWVTSSWSCRPKYSIFTISKRVQMTREEKKEGLGLRSGPWNMELIHSFSQAVSQHNMYWASTVWHYIHTNLEQIITRIILITKEKCRMQWEPIQGTQTWDQIRCVYRRSRGL